MKYIRTKDNIYLKIRDTEYDNEHIVVGKTPVDFGTYILKKDIIEQSDNLAKLCDEFVIDDRKNKVRYLMDYEDVIEELYDGRIYEHDFVYGAIWCEWGLKYVVKVDNKGGLELI